MNDGLDKFARKALWNERDAVAEYINGIAPSSTAMLLKNYLQLIEFVLSRNFDNLGSFALVMIKRNKQWATFAETERVFTYMPDKESQ